MIPRDTIDRIYSTARIEEVVGDYVSLRKRGANLIGLCPFHEEKTGSFTVSPAKGIYKCFGCGKAGQVTSFVMEIEQCSYVEALRLLAKRYHIEIEERELTKEEQQQQDDRESMFVVNEFAAKFFEEQLWDTREGQAIGLSYLRQRGLRDDIIRRFRLGYSPDKSLFAETAQRKGFDPKFLVNDSQHAPYIGTGLCLQAEDGRLYDRFHSRVIFPFFSRSGKVTGFAGRIMKQNDKVGKYVNSPTSPLFEKHNELYGLFQAKQQISRLNHAYLVEGQMDVISMHQAGIENVVSSGGTSLTKTQIQLLHRFANDITILYDGDKAGIKAALRGIDMVLEEGINVKIVLLPEGEDPDSFARSHNADEVKTYVESHQQDFIRFKTALLQEEAGQDPLKRSELIRSVMQSIAVIPDAITRQVYTKDCAELLHTREDVLTAEVAKRRNERKQTASTRTNATGSQIDTVPSTTAQPTTAQSTTAQSVPNITSAPPTPFDFNLQNLLQLMMRYGEQTIGENSDGTPITCGQYILDNLREDGITPRLPLHQLALNEYEQHCHDNGFRAEDFFLHHSDNRLSTLAVALTTDPYPLSRIFSHKYISENVQQKIQTPSDADILPEMTQQLLLEIKNTVVNEQISRLQNQLQQAQTDNDWNTIRELLTQIPQWMALRTQISQQLGNRVLNP